MEARKNVRGSREPKKRMSPFVVAVIVWAMVMTALVIWLLVSRLGQASNRDGELPDEIVDTMYAAIELEPFFDTAQGIYSAKASDQGWTSLSEFVMNWGVVLPDGTVVLNPMDGHFGFDEKGRLTAMQWQSVSDDAMIVYGLDLPEAWQGYRIVVVPSMDETTHLVTVSAVNQSAMNASGNDAECGLWEWQDGEYHRVAGFALDEGEFSGPSGSSDPGAQI